MIFRCLFFSLGLGDVPKTVREAISLTGFPRVFEYTPKQGHVDYIYHLSHIYINYKFVFIPNTEKDRRTERNEHMNKMKLVEGTNYRRRYHQPIPTPPKSKELVSCLWCDTSSYPDDALSRNGRQEQASSHIYINYIGSCGKQPLLLLLNSKMIRLKQTDGGSYCYR